MPSSNNQHQASDNRSASLLSTNRSSAFLRLARGCSLAVPYFQLCNDGASTGDCLQSQITAQEQPTARTRQAVQAALKYEFIYQQRSRACVRSEVLETKVCLSFYLQSSSSAQGAVLVQPQSSIRCCGALPLRCALWPASLPASCPASKNSRHTYKTPIIPQLQAFRR
jgi:hypothetical protein